VEAAGVVAAVLILRAAEHRLLALRNSTMLDALARP
jgi:hypothetical protein